MAAATATETAALSEPNGSSASSLMHLTSPQTRRASLVSRLLFGPRRNLFRHFGCRRVASSLTNKQIDGQTYGSSALLNRGFAIAAKSSFRRFWISLHRWRFRRL